MKAIIRKEVHLEPAAVTRLQKLADKKKWSLKQYMESVLVKDSAKWIEVITESNKKHKP
jgi:hypothetical protein